MQMIGSIFYIIIFTGFIGSLFSMGMIFLRKIMQPALPIWGGILNALFFLIPVVVSRVKLVSPEGETWIAGYKLASVIWLCGMILCLLGYLLRSLFAYRTVRSFSECSDERVSQVFMQCAKKLGRKHLPKLLCGTLKEPVCVVTIFRPAVILKEDILRQLSDQELQIIFGHELIHITRKHHLMQRIYDMVTILHWFNLLAWIVKYEFSYDCEVDCDTQALKMLNSLAAPKEYVSTMLHLLELSNETGSTSHGKMGALSFARVKQRFTAVLYRVTPKKQLAMLLILTICSICTLIVSAASSRAMFYPYPAYSLEKMEFSESFD